MTATADIDESPPAGASCHCNDFTDGDTDSVRPVVVLTKADVDARTPALIAARVESLKGRLPASINILIVDGTDPGTAWRFAAYVAAGQTLVLLGSSGAGKSTLTHVLLGAAVQHTGAVLLDNRRDKHTTTSRSLQCLPGGACVIDTPGLRALRPDSDEATLTASFRHRRARVATSVPRLQTPGRVRLRCARERAARPPAQLHKLLREARRDTLSVLERQQQVAAWKERGRATRVNMKAKRDDGPAG